MRTHDVFTGTSEMGALMRSIDWSQTPVGPVEKWPQSLKTALSILLRQRTAVFIFWGPEHVQFYNDAYRPILGTKKHPTAMGQRGRDCWREIWDIIQPLLDAVYRGASTAVEDGLLVIDRNGYLEEGYYTYTYSPIIDEDNKVGGAFCVVYDTTERVIGERRLRTLRDLASRSSTAKTAEEACGAAAETLAANPRDIPFAALYLYDAIHQHAQLVGTAGVEPGTAVSPPVISLEKDGESVIAAAARSGHVEVIDGLARLLGPLPGGSWPVGAESGIVMPIMLPGQTLPAGFLLSGISPRKRLDQSYRTFFELVNGQIATAVAEARAYEEERRRAEALAELDRAKTAFFSNISHEFRTPLTLMLGPVEDLLSRLDEDSGAVREELNLVHRNGLRLLKLVNALLDFARIEAGRVQAYYEAVNLATLTADIASVFRSAVEKAGLRLILDFPPGPEPVYVDRDMWEKILLNLLSNALKFTFTGEIAVRLRYAHGFAELSVRDTGTGIPAEHIERIFERFHRVEGARGRTMEGSGIGLALVQELVKLHGGSVRVESEPGRGSEFFISIPLGREHLPASRIMAGRPQDSAGLGARPYVEEAMRWLPEAAHQPADILELPTIGNPREAKAGERPRILVADDNADMREYARRLLSERYDLELCADGAAALTALRQRGFDLVLTDVMMPHLEGFGLLRAIRNDPSLCGTPVILISARAGEEARIEGLEAGADDYLVKPFGARELLARVSSRIEVARLRREAAARERELRLAAEAERRRWHDLLLLAPALVAVLRGPTHIFDLANPTYLKAVGRTDPSSMVGKPIREALPEVEGQGYFELLDGVYRTGEAYVGNEHLVRLGLRGDGTLEDRYFNFVYQPSRNIDGEVEGILVHAMDVTEQVLIRKRVEESESRFRELADSMPQIVWTADANGQHDYYNERWYQCCGVSREDGGSTAWVEVLHPADRETWESEWSRAVAAAEPFQLECRLYDRQAGAYRWHLARALPARHGQGRPARWYGTCTDIEDQKRAEEAIRQKQRLESTGLLAGGVAHDFNNLLTGVLGNASLLLDELPPDDPKAELLQDVLNAAERAAHLTRQMLAYAGKGSFIIRPLSLSDQVREIAHLIQAAIPKKVTLRLDIPEGLPMIEGDSGQIQQIIMNLVINAAEAIGEGRSGTVRISARAEQVADANTEEFVPEKPRGGHYYVLEVRDNGEGMSPEVVARIFDPFFTTKFTGRGLGLSAVLGIVRSHHGALTVETEPKQGSVFRVYLPAMGASVEAPMKPSGEIDHQGQGTVLVVDDEEVVRRTARHTLTRFGYTVLAAADGAEGVKILEQRAPAIDVVLLDLTMPVMDGLEALNHFRRIAPDLPVILSSGYDEHEATQRFSGSGLAGFIQKPYTAVQLAQKIKEACVMAGSEKATGSC